jgi:hypothetical protein
MQLEWVETRNGMWWLERVDLPTPRAMMYVESTPSGWTITSTGWGQRKCLGVYETLEEAKAMAVIKIRMERNDGTQLSR